MEISFLLKDNENTNKFWKIKIFNANVNLFAFVISEIFGLWNFQVDWLEEQRKMEFLFPTVMALLCSAELKLRPSVSDSSQKVEA